MTRMWLVNPKYLCRNHLLGEHKELVSDLSANQQNREKEKEKDKEGSVSLDFNAFLDIMTTKMSEKDSETELNKAFILFS